MNIVDIQARIAEVEAQLGELVDAGQFDDARKAEGQLMAYREQLTGAIAEMEAQNAALKSAAIEDEAPSFAEQLFGRREDFVELEPGFRGSARMDAATSLDVPVVTSTDLPGYVAPPANFLETLPKGTTNAEEKYFTAPTLTNAAAGWTTGNKPESAIEWAEATAHLETIAHWIPIHKQMARRYDVLESTTRGALLSGLKQKADEMAVSGSNSNGIVGITNTTGIIAHTLVTAGDLNLYDNLIQMRRKVRVASGYAPNYVAMSPAAIEALAAAKDKNGNYLFKDIEPGARISGMTLVEDVNLTGSGETPKEGALVYYNGGASWKVADPETVEVGLTDKQFIQNAYTLLAETTALLRVDVPAAFAYCADLGL